MGLKWTITKKLLRYGARGTVRKQLKHLRDAQPELFSADRCPQEHQRGIDFYPKAELEMALAQAFLGFHLAHGCFPNLCRPIGFNEKIVWAKFFQSLKLPESGNKLLTPRFIPESLQDRLKYPEIVWNSDNAKLPDNEFIQAGDYYLKSNHASGLVKRIRYPLELSERSKLEHDAAGWLKDKKGLRDGEWWYHAFPIKLMLEKAVTQTESSISWGFYVFNGEVPFITTARKEPAPKQSAWLDGSINRLPYNDPMARVMPDDMLCKQRAARLLPMAQEIAKGYPFMRVDFLQGDDGRDYLNEITFSPSNGRKQLPKELDQKMGALWRLP